MLLYSLIAKYKPKNVLEFGTAEGYSALCMAWAMTDYDINGRIFTIDPKPFDIPVEREITWEKNPEHKTTLLSTKELWNKFAKEEWIKKIEVLTGFSGEILQKNAKVLPKMDMGFIDDELYKAHDKRETSTPERNTVYSTSKTKTVLKILNDGQLKNIKKR